MAKASRPRVYTAADARADPSTQQDGFLQKVVKYIPSEIVAGYVAIADALKPSAEVMKEAIKNDKPVDYTVLWIVFWVLLILTPLYTWFFTQEPDKPKPVYQTVVAPIAFSAWVFALGGPFTPIKDSFHLPALGLVVLILVLLIIPLTEKVFAPEVTVPPVNNQ